MTPSTPHIKLLNDRGFAKTVLMPGDPLRAKYIAETMLTDAVLVNDVRGVQGYTGFYNGKPVSVMASGMGMPSIGIYSYELYTKFGVETILRVGSAGAMQESLDLRDVVAGLGACTNSNFAAQYGLSGTFSPIADYGTLKKAEAAANEMGFKLHVGNILSSDTFYSDDTEANAHWKKMGVLAVEMESAALYMTAARCGKKALCICTISDLLYDSSRELTADERQQSMNDMLHLALKTATAD
ncbi:MAG: purine-nucleoside phosphorylase [Clostridia bacterium]|nr:purine-nucleoside phosphorylase [Clostridia bacterium]